MIDYDHILELAKGADKITLIDLSIQLLHIATTKIEEEEYEKEEYLNEE